MNKIIRIGYDIRSWPPISICSSDRNCWPFDEELYRKAKKLASAHSNEFGLLQIRERGNLMRLVEMDKRTVDSCLVGFDIFASSAEAIRKSWGWPVYENAVGDLAWRFVGFDICEASSFISFFQMTTDSEKADYNLCYKDEACCALEMVQCANIAIPSHAPFLVCGLSVLGKFGVPGAWGKGGGKRWPGDRV